MKQAQLIPPSEIEQKRKETFVDAFVTATWTKANPLTHALNVVEEFDRLTTLHNSATLNI